MAITSTPEIEAEIIRLYQDLGFITDIAGKFGCSVPYIYNVLTRHGITRRGRPRRKIETKPCLYIHCDKQFTARTANKQKYCSPQCRSLANAKRGSENPAWRGGSKTLLADIRRNTYYRDWRVKILRRDWFTCQKCGHKSTNLEVHHHTQLAKMVRDHSVTSVKEAQQCEALWDLSLGETLCSICHAQTPDYKAKGRF